MLLPFRKITIETSLNADEVKERLGLIIGAVEYITNPFAVDIPYYGSIYDDNFTMKPVRTIVKNDFAPIVTGNILYKENRTEIQITARMKIGVIILLAFVLCFCLFAIFTGPSRIQPAATTTLVLAYGVPMLVFHYGIHRMKSRINDVLENIIKL